MQLADDVLARSKREGAAIVTWYAARASVATAKQRVTYAEYLAAEASSEQRHEFIAGDVIAHPEVRAAMFGLDREQEPIRRRFFGCSRLG